LNKCFVIDVAMVYGGENGTQFLKDELERVYMLDYCHLVIIPKTFSGSNIPFHDSSNIFL